MRIIDDIKPKASAKRTNAQVNNPGITYNEAGVSYNDARYAYGGVYDSDVFPSFLTTASIRPSSFAKPTLAQLNSVSITYNEAGVSYDDSRYAYGGIYGQQDVFPSFVLSTSIRPRIVFAGDFQGTAILPPVTNSGMLIGMLGMTYP
jgi:hypothetical protein